MVRKHYLYAGDRRVHYRRSGNGPPLVVLSAVPQSSAMLEPLIEALAARHTVIALDAPGYGESEALPVETPAVSDYTAALLETINALHLPRFDLYGVDTGAPVALDFALKHSGRVRRIVLDRPPLLTDDERDELVAKYCPVFDLDPEGGHVTRYWGRLRDIYTFRPWYQRSNDARIRRDLPAPLAMHHEIVDFFRAGQTYWQGPHAAWRYDTASALPTLSVPTTILHTLEGRERMVSLPSVFQGSFVEIPNQDANDLQQQVAALMLAALAGDPLPDAPPPPDVVAVPGKIRRTYVDSRAGQLLVRMVGSGTGGGRPVLLFYGSLWSGAGSADAALGWAVDRPVFGFDMPGVGDSPALPGTPSITEISEAILDGVDALGLTEYDLPSGHTSAVVAMEMAIARPQQVKHLILDGLTMYTEEQLKGRDGIYLQPLRISADGSYLTWAWHFIRDMNMWYPWYDHTADHFRSDGFVKDAAGHQARLLDFLKGGLTFDNPYGALMRYSTRARLPLVKVPTLLCSAPEDTLRDKLEEAASYIPDAIVMETPGKRTPEKAAQTRDIFLRFFADAPISNAAIVG